MKINFKCIELTIQDEELGCTVTFSDTRSADDQFKTLDEIMLTNEKYFLIQRTYAEDEYDKDHYHMESSESDANFDPNEKVKMSINQGILEAKWLGEQVIIGLNLKNQKLEHLLRVLETKFNERITIIK